MVQILIILPEIAKAVGGIVTLALFWLTVQTIYQYQHRPDSIESGEQDAENQYDDYRHSEYQDVENCLGCSRFGLCKKSRVNR